MFLEKRRKQTEDRFREIVERYPDETAEVLTYRDKVEEKTYLLLQYFYTTMPHSDMVNYSAEVFASYAAHGVKLWETYARVQNLPEDIFLNYVAHYRVNTEEIQPCREYFYDLLSGEIQGLDTKEAVLAVNYWCASHVTYRSTDDRTSGARSIFERTYGRCGEESVFGVSALRSVGIPARQVYAPRWSHCDDNHAWAEVWLDGSWNFLGACEPEEILDRGWFTNASSRAMMIHSKCFDSSYRPKEPAGGSGMVVYENHLERYAHTRLLTVRILDEAGCPAPGACVDFEVVNYAEFVPVASLYADQNGEAALRTGLGMLYLHAFGEAGEAFGFVDVRECTEIELSLAIDGTEGAWESFALEVPVDAPLHTDMPTEKKRERLAAKLAEAAAKRKEKEEKFLAYMAGGEKYDNLEGEERLQKMLLGQLSDKDLHDSSAAVLKEHLELAAPYEQGTLPALFASCVLNPRIDYEPISAYRGGIQAYFTDADKKRFCSNPEEVWRYISDHIKEEADCAWDDLVTLPLPCLTGGIGSRKSKEILFVAICRTLGIPARLNPVDRMPEYAKDGVFYKTEAEAKTAKLSLDFEEGCEWTYMQNWTLGKKDGGRYTSLQMADLPARGRVTLELEPGDYRLVICNRLPNGNLLGNLCRFTLQAEAGASLKAEMPKAELSQMLEQIALQDFELLDEQGKSVSAKALSGDWDSLFIWLEAGKEPTEHILNELRERSEEFNEKGTPIYLIGSGPEIRSDVTFLRTWPVLEHRRLLFDPGMSHVNTLGRRLYVDPEKLPLILAAAPNLTGIYAASGYNVGTADMLLKILSREQ